MTNGKEIQQNTGKTYYAATKFFPERVRGATFDIYGFVRTADDFVDKPRGKNGAEQRAAVEDYRRRAIAAIKNSEAESDTVLVAFAKTVREHNIPELEIHAFLDAMAADATKKRYKDLHDVERYMRGSATAVGNMMLSVMGYTGERESVKKQARALAEAFQMTNFLRDIDEDYHQLGRIYLPQNLMEKHGVTEEDIKKRRMTLGMKRLVHELSVWTRNKYYDGIQGIKHLKKDCRFPVLLATVLYLRVLEKIEKDNWSPFGKRARLSKTEKARIVASTAIRYKALKQSELKICKLAHA